LKSISLLLLVFQVSSLCATEPASNAPAGAPNVSYERLARAIDEPQNWLTYWGDYPGTRFRNLTQINDANVKHLRVEWIYQTEQQATETVPLVVDGVMYFTASNGYAFALDPKTGRELWRYHYVVPENAKGCCATVNRGLAVLGSRLFLATPDAHLIALDARNGQPLWNISYAPNAKSYGATLAPLAINGKVVVGTSGGEFGARGFVAAFDAASGKESWRFATIPAKGEPGSETWGGRSGDRGGAPTWMTGTFDPESNTLYWGVGNPGPDLNGDVRPGDNLYADCLIALDADTGRLKWHFQFTPHDTHDWDAAETPMLLDLPWRGKPRKLVMQANRNSFYYVLDRVTGEFLYARPFARQNWATGIDAKGRPILAPTKTTADDGSDICPGQAGGTNWMAPSFQPSLGLFYLTIREQCDTFHSNPVVYKEGRPYIGGSQRGVDNEREYGLVAALDVLTGEMRWSFRLNRAPWAGTLATGGNLVFAGDEDGYLMAFSAKTGQLLWKINTGNRLVTSPITYEFEGRQYVTMPSGNALLTFALPEE
jgi:alcohol dehydrogenase (cytochrome c)